MNRPDEGPERDRTKEARNPAISRIPDSFDRDSSPENVPRGLVLGEILENLLLQAQTTEKLARDLSESLCGRVPRPGEGQVEEPEPDTSILDSYLRQAKAIMRRVNSINEELSRIEREFRG